MWIKVATNETIRNMITLRLSMYTPSGKAERLAGQRVARAGE